LSVKGLLRYEGGNSHEESLTLVVAIGVTAACLLGCGGTKSDEVTSEQDALNGAVEENTSFVDEVGSEVPDGD